MKTDIKLKSFINNITFLRCYNDDLSIMIRLKIIEELNMQIKNVLIHNHEKIVDRK